VLGAGIANDPLSGPEARGTRTALDRQQALAVSQRAIGTHLGDYTLTSGDGAPLRLADARGKPLIVTFVYTGCTQVCPTATRFLARAIQEAQAALGRDAFRVITVGFNLPFDTPVAMREFRNRHGIAAANWDFAAGDAPTIAALARDTGFVWMQSAGGFDHVTQATIVDARGRVVRQVYGDSFELPMLIGPLKELVAGSPVPAQDLTAIIERVRLLCTVYDPRSGRYRPDYALAIEILAGISVIGAVVFFVGNEWRRQRRANA
jgi:protein SCO1